MGIRRGEQKKKTVFQLLESASPCTTATPSKPLAVYQHDSAQRQSRRGAFRRVRFGWDHRKAANLFLSPWPPDRRSSKNRNDLKMRSAFPRSYLSYGRRFAILQVFGTNITAYGSHGGYDLAPGAERIDFFFGAIFASLAQLKRALRNDMKNSFQMEYFRLENGKSYIK